MINILLAEDNYADVYLVRLALEEVRLSYTLHVVMDGGEALKAVQHLGEPGHMPCPDLVLLDINLPKVDGPQILKELRKRPNCETTPVIVVSSSDLASDTSRVAGLGAAGYFRKTSDLHEFLKLGELVKEMVSV